MRSQESKVSGQSDYYIYTPSMIAQKLYIYPKYTGYFIYEAGYHIRRNSYDSYLIMYIAKGSCSIRTNDSIYKATNGQFVLLDCYKPHEYGSPGEWEACWMHFDGALAGTYYEEITSIYGQILSPQNAHKLVHSLNQICELFRSSTSITESSLSETITRMLNHLLVYGSTDKRTVFHTTTITDSIAYIREHFKDSLSLELLSEKAGLSPYHFTRVFTRETGYTPHQHLIITRISAAKFLLHSSVAPIKEIAFNTGFNSESSFCNTFKKWENITPSQYRLKSTVTRPI